MLLPRLIPTRLSPLVAPKLARPLPRFASIPSSTPPPPSIPRPPQKHKKGKAKASVPPARPPTATPIGSKGLRLQEFDFFRPIQQRPADGLVVALSTAQSYNFQALVESLNALGLVNGARNLIGEAVYLPRWSPGGSPIEGDKPEVGEIFLFESGSIVAWGLKKSSVELFLRTVIRGASDNGALGWVEQGRYSEHESEVLEYRVEPKSLTKIVGDTIILTTPPSPMEAPTQSGVNPPDDLLARLAFSAGMARITKLGVYEQQFDHFATGTAGIPQLLEAGSKEPFKKKEIIKRVGILHSFRQKLNLEDENLLDEPEFLWEDSQLYSQYTSICNALEFQPRLETLNQRLEYAFQLEATLLDLMNTDTSHRLEWIIIILIAFEISIVLIREIHGLLTDDEPSANETKSPKVAIEA
ncbi:hypothetical protein MNV49_000132 [Pseudohyphozyma bogoriensis]|nr:hypothetical protein MNV49_000132 [Pseudohyphozyma bogoriensis]